MQETLLPLILGNFFYHKVYISSAATALLFGSLFLWSSFWLEKDDSKWCSQGATRGEAGFALEGNGVCAQATDSKCSRNMSNSERAI
jgi:hypothetical protein